MFSTLNQLFHYDFIQMALLAGTLAAAVSAVIGYFLVIRSQNFAAHALSHIGFAGAAGAGLLGFTPVVGQLILTLLAAIGMGALGEKIAKRDIAIGMILSFSLGLGILFLHFYTHHAGQAMSILFGDLLGITPDLIREMCIYSAISLVGLAVIGKRLLFTTLEPELAEAKGVSLRGISIAFMVLVAIAVTEASQVVGILLVFTLLVAPVATALCWTRTVIGGILTAVVIGILEVWLGIIIAYFTNFPIAFWISALSFGGYLVAKIVPLPSKTRPC